MNGIIHAHSRYSYDGTLHLQQLRELFIARGLQFACMTEHTDGLARMDAERFIRECRDLSDERFIFIPGFEVPHLGTHVLVLGADTYHEGDGHDVLARWHQEGALLVLAHPHRNGYHTDQFLHDHLDGVEIWNAQYDGIHAPRRQAQVLFRKLADKRRIVAYGSLDLHRASHASGPKLELDVPLAEADILKAFRSGSFRICRGRVVLNSQGIVLQGGTLRIAVLGTVLPMLVSFLQFASSLLHHIGIRSFPLKRWVRTRI